MPALAPFRRNKLSPKTAQLLDRVKRAACSRPFMLKSALGGEGQDIPFEQAFADLAHSYIQDRAPQLTDYEVGFQLVDRNDDNTKAVGMFGFRVGSQWLYAPVFFLNGALKGHELLYIVNQDMFVPLKENWINYLVNRRPLMLGSQVTRNSQQLGVRGPDMRQLSESPSQTKFSSAIDKYPQWIQPVMPKLAHWVTTNYRTDPKYKDLISLPEFLKTAGEPYVRLLIKVATTYPTIAKAIVKFHGPNMLREAVENCKQARYKMASALHPQPTRMRKVGGSALGPIHPYKKGSIQVYNYTAELESDVPTDLTPQDKEELLRDGVLIKDKREDDAEVSHRYKVEVSKALTNPTETGLYEVLTRAGNFEKCLVLFHPFWGGGKREGCIVYPVSGSKNAAFKHPNHVVVGRQYSQADFQEWLDGQGNASPEPGPDKYIAVGPDGLGTAPFSVESSVTSDGETTYNIKTDCCMLPYRVDHLPDNPASALNLEYDRYTDGERLHVGAKRGSKMRVAARGDVYVPENYKIFKVETASENERKGWEEYGKSQAQYDGDKVLQLGDQASIHLNILQKSAELKIQNTGNEVVFFPSGLRFTNVKSAVVHLVRDRGFRIADAEEMLKEAHAAPSRIKTFNVKYASPFLTDNAISAPGIPDMERSTSDTSLMGANVPTQLPEEHMVPVDSVQADPSAAQDAYNLELPDENTMVSVNDAANTGQREVFDTAMVGGLLKATRKDMMVDRYIPDLMKGMDRLGRLLFIFYWHQEDFADRFGQDDLPEFEDALRNTFESNGDIVLKLKQQAVDPMPEDQGGIDLGSIADA